MTKYDPLRRYLARQKQASVRLTFTEIERIIGAMLPKAAMRAQWWANGDAAKPTQIQAASWNTAGFDAFLDGAEHVRFDRAV